MGSSGLEPPTSRLSGARSNQLSYEPACRACPSSACLRAFTRFHHQLKSLFTTTMEMMGFEPMTPCLQGRCSPNWATPPCWLPIVLFCVLLFTMNNWMNLVHNRLLLVNSSSMRVFQVLAGFLSIPASRHASTTHSKLNNNILTPIWFRVGTRISRSP